MKFKINIDTLSGETIDIKVPISTEIGFAGQEEVINEQFVEEEVKRVTNATEDFEQVRLKPKTPRIDYKLTFASGVDTFFGLGFTVDDIKFNRNNFKNSFLSLDFYDSNITVANNLVARITLYPQVNRAATADADSIKAIKTIFSTINPNDDRPANRFIASEGYFMYYFKDQIAKAPNVTSLYMEATFNNAKTGISTPMITISNPTDLSDLLNNTFTEYELTKDTNGYEYNIVGNIAGSTPTTTVVNLFERAL